MRRNEKKKYKIAIIVVAIISFFLGRCSVSRSGEDNEDIETTDSVEIVAEEQEKAIVVEDPEMIDSSELEYDTIVVEAEAAVEILSRKPDAKWENHLEVDDSEVAQPLETHFRGSRSATFNDSNHVQLKAAEAMGIKPITDMSSAWNLSRPVKKLASCEEYYLDELTHSYPFLVPEAEQLLREIGARFNQLLWERGQSKYRIKVTSVLRTPETIKDLMRSNKNAIAVSTHQYATTFDISYSKFIRDAAENPRTFGDLSALLSEVINEFYSKGRCYVKFEGKQSCFHITVRPQK